MKKTLATVLTVLSLSTVLLLHPARAISEDKPAAPEVKIDNFTFGPMELTVPVNSTVTWVNKDDIPHTVVATDGAFKSRALDTDQKFSFKFEKAGTYTYYCSVHPKMLGKIVVQ
ncbi:MAG TPA: cupredoxin family copper-binding protein [Terriglobales bacterium]|nr:cupredoxin family copper-binding protein [Terriglobales bacterium]